MDIEYDNNKQLSVYDKAFRGMLVVSGKFSGDDSIQVNTFQTVVFSLRATCALLGVVI